MAPEVGLEPTTLRLTAECSAIELLRSVLERGYPHAAFIVITNTDMWVKGEIPCDEKVAEAQRLSKTGSLGWNVSTN